jgi:chaperonin GroEL
VAVINVGAATETEMKEKKARVEDALNATRAAVEEGVVPGGGVVFIRAMDALYKLKMKGEEKIGADIVRKAMEAPLRQIANNAGAEGSLVAQKVKELPTNEGYNADADKYEDMVAAGIIDPTKVVRLALQHSSSIAGLMLTTEALVTEMPEEEKVPPAPPGGGMGGMY